MQNRKCCLLQHSRNGRFRIGTCDGCNSGSSWVADRGTADYYVLVDVVVSADPGTCSGTGWILANSESRGRLRDWESSRNLHSSWENKLHGATQQDNSIRIKCKAFVTTALAMVRCNVKESDAYSWRDSQKVIPRQDQADNRMNSC